MRSRIIVALATALLYGNPLAAQGVPRVHLGWGVDPASSAWSEISWHGHVAEILDRWREYLLSDPHMQTPTPLWSSAEQRLWPAYDLTAGVVYKGMPATVVDIRPQGSGAEFVVKTLFASTSAEDRAVRPVALTRVYAIQEEGRWVFANALPRLTRGWQRATVGPITYVIDPRMSFDERRGERAVAFADSLATSLDLPRIEDVTYVMASSPEELHRIMGIDWTFGGQGHGYALPWNRLILSGDRTFGEDNRHELVHYVIAPILAERRTHPIVNEGLATWLGGSVGCTYAEIVEAYAAFLRENPNVELDSVLEGDGPDQGWNPAGAILVGMAYEEGGWQAVRRLLTGGRSNDELRAILVELLGAPWNDITAIWRTKTSATHQ
jgi:hypothetical protein